MGNRALTFTIFLYSFDLTKPTLLHVRSTKDQQFFVKKFMWHISLKSNITHESKYYLATNKQPRPTICFFSCFSFLHLYDTILWETVWNAIFMKVPNGCQTFCQDMDRYSINNTSSESGRNERKNSELITITYNTDCSLCLATSISTSISQ